MSNRDAPECAEEGHRQPWPKRGEYFDGLATQRGSRPGRSFGPFTSRRTRVLDASGYVTLMRWRLYAEEGLAGRQADLWLLENTLTVEHAGEPLSAYEVAYQAAGGRSGSGRLLAVSKPTLFETPFAPGQPRLFGLAEALGDDGWLKALRLEDYAARRPRPSTSLQQILFPYGEAWG